MSPPCRNEHSVSSTSHTQPGTSWQRRDFAPYGGAAAFIIAVHLVTNGILGFHIDELHYLASGRHLAFGYGDCPPIVPLLARLETGLLGVSPWTLRLLPSLLSGVLVIFCGLHVRELGGSHRRQGLELLSGVIPLLIGSNWLFRQSV